MPLRTASPVAFIPTSNAEAARAFYEHTLGLSFIADEPYAVVFRIGPEPGIALRLVRLEGHQPNSFTIFGWEVDDLAAAVDDLVRCGVTFERYSFLQQDDRGIWHAPDRAASIAWFKDPDGNTLSLAQHGPASH